MLIAAAHRRHYTCYVFWRLSITETRSTLCFGHTKHYSAHQTRLHRLRIHDARIFWYTYIWNETCTHPTAGFDGARVMVFWRWWCWVWWRCWCGRERVREIERWCGVLGSFEMVERSRAYVRVLWVCAHSHSTSSRVRFHVQKSSSNECDTATHFSPVSPSAQSSVSL